MLKCWEADPKLRPSFEDLGLFLRGTQTVAATSEIRDIGKQLAEMNERYRQEAAAAAAAGQ